MKDHGWRITIAVAAVAAVMFYTALGSTRLIDDDEPRNSSCAQEMLNRGDWIVPTFNGALRTDKPILLYWCMLAVYNLFGVSEFTARLPSALAGVGTVVLTYHLGRLLLDRRSGLIASCFLICALYFAILARWATPDSLLILCVTASLACFVAGVAARRGGHFSGCVLGQSQYCRPIVDVGLPTIACVGMYVAMGLAVLAKGPIGVVTPLGIIGSYLLLFDAPSVPAAYAPTSSSLLQRLAPYFRRGAGYHWLQLCKHYLNPPNIFRVLRTLRLTWGLPLVALVALPWYIAVAVATKGAWVAGFIGNHNVNRFLNPMEHHNGYPLYQAFYLAAIFAGFFPGSVFLPAAFWSSAKEVYDNRPGRSSSAFLLCWVGCYVGFFTLAATKLANYVVPCYPALALVTGGLLSTVVARGSARDWRLTWGYSALAVVGAIAVVAIGLVAPKFFPIDPSLALPGIVALVGGVVCIMLLIGNRVQASLVNFIAVCLLITATALMYSAPQISTLEDGPLLAKSIQSLILAEPHEVHVATYRYSAPSLTYYLHHPVERIDEAAGLADYFARGDILVMPRDAYEKERDHLPGDVTVLAEQPRFLRNKSSVVMLGRRSSVALGDFNDVHAH
jgi:4-amino-4-deoxy-L-arabinose transferase-like glycosyltransferase